MFTQRFAPRHSLTSSCFPLPFNRIARLFYSRRLYQLLQRHRQTMVYSMNLIQLFGNRAITAYDYLLQKFMVQCTLFLLQIGSSRSNHGTETAILVALCVCVCFSPPSITFRDNARISYSFPTTFNSWFTNHRTVGRCVIYWQYFNLESVHPVVFS
jgi:hypothetical protein